MSIHMMTDPTSIQNFSDDIFCVLPVNIIGTMLGYLTVNIIDARDQILVVCVIPNHGPQAAIPESFQKGGVQIN